MNAKEEGGEDEILAKTATTERKQMKRKERRIGRFSSLVAGLFTEPICIVVAPSRCVTRTPPFPLVFCSSLNVLDASQSARKR